MTGQIDTYVRVYRLDDAGRLALFTEARTANAFTDTLVPDRTLRAIWQLARWGYFLLAARAHGLAVGPMAGFDTDGVTAEFFPGGRHRALLVVNLGHPAAGAWHPRLPRLDTADVLEFK